MTLSTPVRAWLAAFAVACFLSPSVALADDYDPQRAGHPVRVAAYVAHPVGVVLDLLIFRPAHWLGSLPVLDVLFGHEVYDD